MQQILHIFKKDVRRHWPEILISLTLLGLYAKIMTRPTDYDPMMTPNYIPWAEISADTLAPLMIIFWIFLTIRVVQSERLVGDTQWWITKPYEWWKLLAAKEVKPSIAARSSIRLFVVFCSVPDRSRRTRRSRQRR